MNKPFSYLTLNEQQNVIKKMRQDYAFQQHVIYHIRKFVSDELNKYSKNDMREVFIDLPCLGKLDENFSFSFVLRYSHKMKGYFEYLVEESLDCFYFMARPDVSYKDFSHARIRYSSDSEEAVLVDGVFGELCGDIGETEEEILEYLYSFIKDLGDDIVYHIREIYEKSFSDEYIRNYIELMGLSFPED